MVRILDRSASSASHAITHIFACPKAPWSGHMQAKLVKCGPITTGGASVDDRGTGWQCVRARADPGGLAAERFPETRSVDIADREGDLYDLVVEAPCPQPTESPAPEAMVRMLAGLGGFLNRKGDGSPGPRTMWIGLPRVADFTSAQPAQRDANGGYG